MDEQECEPEGRCTPEPWEIEEADGDFYITHGQTHVRKYIAKVFGNYDARRKNQKADALLICAAPTLLAACEEVLYRLEPGELAAILAAAILKAKPL
jgi:hypothetical protein